MSEKPFHSSIPSDGPLDFPTGNRPITPGGQEHPLLAAIIEASDDAIYARTLDGIITAWNPAAKRMFGYAATRMIGTSSTVLFPPDRWEQEEVLLDRLRRAIPIDRFETVRLHRNGTPIDVSVTMLPIRDAEGRVIGAATIDRDITERKQGEEQVRLLSTVAAESISGIVITDPQERMLYVNAAFERISGYVLEELKGRRPAEALQGSGTDAETRGLVRAAIAAQEPVTVEILNYHKNGMPYWIEMHIAPVRDRMGAVTHFVAAENDVTLRKQVEQQRQESAERLRVSEERYALAVEGSQNGLWDWDIRTGEIHLSARWVQMMGYVEGEFPTHAEAVMEHIHSEDRPRVEATLEAYLNREIDVYDIEFRICHKDGSYRWVLSRGVARFDSEGKPYRMAGSRMDITEHKQLTEQLQTANTWQEKAIEQLTLQQEELSAANARLESLATMDGLTGIENHRAFQDRLKQEYDRAVRYHSPLSVVFLDVDRFKEYNDTYGHPAGDVVLQQIAAILQEHSRSTDILARYGGEEFVLILPETQAEEARLLAEQLRQKIAEGSWEHDGVTASFGVATLSLAIPNAAALFREADKALYRSKYRGRNCVTHVADALEDETLDTRILESFHELIQTVVAGQGEMLLSASEQMTEMLIQSYNATIASWSRILDMRDKETEGHSERVTEMMVRLAQHLGMNDEEVMFARWGAWLHDIGKMAVPDGILHKSGLLTEEEWVIMRQHTTVAYEMLAPIKFLGPALDIPYCHHEKWDGSGYPRGLKGDDIPLMAQLFAVIDVYDALTSDRPYRKAWPEEKVRAHLQQQAGTHFSPRAVDAFLNMLEEHSTTR